MLHDTFPYMKFNIFGTYPVINAKLIKYSFPSLIGSQWVATLKVCQEFFSFLGKSDLDEIEYFFRHIWDTPRIKLKKKYRRRNLWWRRKATRRYIDHLWYLCTHQITAERQDRVFSIFFSDFVCDFFLHHEDHVRGAIAHIIQKMRDDRGGDVVGYIAKDDIFSHFSSSPRRAKGDMYIFIIYDIWL